MNNDICIFTVVLMLRDRLHQHLQKKIGIDEMSVTTVRQTLIVQYMNSMSFFSNIGVSIEIKPAPPVTTTFKAILYFTIQISFYVNNTIQHRTKYSKHQHKLFDYTTCDE